MNVNSIMKRVGRAAEFLAWALFFAACLLVLALRFWLLPDIERFRGHIEVAAAHAIGQPLSVGRIEAHWYGLHPRISLRDVRIRDAGGREVLVLPAVENVVSWRSLLRGRPKLRSLVIDGLRLQVRRDREGALHVAGMKTGGDTAFRDWALAQEEIVLRNAEVEWHDERRGAPPLVLAGLNLRLRNDGGRYALGLAARPPQALASTLELRALLDDAGSGRLYVELGYTDLAAWDAWLDYPFPVRRGEGALRVWLTLENGSARAATADLVAAGVDASLGEALAPLELASIQGRVQARMHDGGYALVARGLALAPQAGPAIAPTDFEARWTPAGGAFRAPALELEPLAFLAAALPLPPPARELLAEVAPRGRLTDLQLEWQGAVRAPERYSGRGRFAALAAAPAGKLPGFAGMEGSFEASEAGGRLQLDARKAALELPAVFPEGPIPFDTLNGELAWERLQDGGVTVRFGSLTAANEDLSGNLYGWYSQLASGQASADLSAQFNRAEARRLGRYLPHGAFLGGQETRDWIARAVVGGRSADVRVRLRGDLADFPFRDPLQGEFSVRVQLEDGALDYAEGWPRIEAIRGELVFERDGLEIKAAEGRVLGATLASVRAAIARLDDPRPLLVVSGEAHGPAAAFLDYIQASPVRGMVDAMTDPIRASGRGRLALHLRLPLADPRRVRLAGEFDLLGSNVAVHPELPTIEDALGTVAFTQSGFTVRELRGRLLGGEVRVSGGTRRDGAVELAVKGEATVAGARPFFDHPLAKHLSGEAAYVASVEVVSGGQKRPPATRFVLASSLRGLGSALPAPLAKAAGEDMPLRLELAPSEGGPGERLSFTLGRVARGELERRRNDGATALARAVIALSPLPGEPLRRPPAAGVHVYGALASLDADKWLALLSATEPVAGALSFEVKIGALDLYGKRVHELDLRGGAEGKSWSAKATAREGAGELSYAPQGEGRLVARLARFRTPPDTPAAAARAATAPRDLPALDLVAERFVHMGRDLGRVEIAGRPAGEDWLIEKLAMANAHARLHAKGAWRGGAPQRIALDFSLQAGNAGAFLDRIGYRDLVRGGRAQLQGHLAWSGEPTTLDYPSLSGEIQLQAEDGRFLEIEPGLGKLVSLMSLQALPRRITLDFRDVFSKGFEFDRIAAAGRIEAGVMAVREFEMRGTSAQVQMKGEVDLAAEKQELRVRVIPSVGDTASTVIGLANPLLAIPAVIVQKILKDPLGHIFAFDYAVSGSWVEPRVEKLGVEAQAVNGQP